MYLEKDFLQYIFGIVSVVQHQVSSPVNQVFVLMKKGGESLFIPCLATAYHVHTSLLEVIVLINYTLLFSQKFGSTKLSKPVVL